MMVTLVWGLCYVWGRGSGWQSCEGRRWLIYHSHTQQAWVGSRTTGTGKTKSLQKLAELLGEKGVPSLVMDIKGTSQACHKKGIIMIKSKIPRGGNGIKWSAESYPTEFMSFVRGRSN